MTSTLSKALTVTAGRPYPLGSTLTADGVNFAVYSERARRILLCLFERPAGEGERIFTLPGKTGHIWHGFVPGIRAGQRYGFRADGAFDPSTGDWFNPAKLLIDPYAAALEGTVVWSDAVYGYRRSSEPDLSICNMQDSSDRVPISLVVNSQFDWEGDRRPDIPLADTVVYETHVKGISNLHPDVPDEMKGTYAGIGHPSVIRHLTSLGITSVELLPIQSFVDDEFLIDAGLRNYWGYNTLGFFAPEARYSASGDSGGQVNEVKQMVKILHRHGLEVILDVVYNHTAEGARAGPTLSLRGIDNRSYYRLDPLDLSQYLNYSGTGNTVNTEHPAALRLVLDSLRHWVQEYHVDGFRFDLAPTLGREDQGFSTRSRFFSALFQDPVLAQVKLIAEPWDIGPGGYQLGHFPTGWSEWNDQFRDTARAVWLDHPRSIGEFALRVSGSVDLYDKPGRGPLASVNFITCHDGFTLTDLVSYNQKHNDRNNEANGDGHDHNLSNNFGVEGQSDDPQIRSQRSQARRNLFATLMLARGIPMMLGGDELSKSQSGNNNAYPQDNELTWYDWNLNNDAQNFLDFVRRAIQTRLSYPQLRPDTYDHAESATTASGRPTAWRDALGSELAPHDWSRDRPRAVQLLLATERGSGPALVILLNAEHQDLEFALPQIESGRAGKWIPILDTSSVDGVPASTEVEAQPWLIAGDSIVLAAWVPHSSGTSAPAST